MDFKLKTYVNNEGHYILVKRSIQQENVTIIKLQIPKQESLKIYEENTDRIQGKINSSIIIVKDFSTHFQ